MISKVNRKSFKKTHFFAPKFSARYLIKNLFFEFFGHFSELKMIIFGVDPGIKGGVAAVENGILVDLFPMPKNIPALICRMAEIIEGRRGRSWVVIEHQAPRPFQHVNAGHAQAYGYGRLVGAMLACGWSVATVTPQTWQKEIFTLAGNIDKAKRKDGDKARSIEAARLFFPRADFVGKGKRKPQDGLCDAALIALWASRNVGRLKALEE